MPSVILGYFVKKRHLSEKLMHLVQQNVELKVNQTRVPQAPLKLSTFRQNKRAMNPLNSWLSAKNIQCGR